MDWKITTTFQNREILGRELLAVERVDFAIFDGLRQLRSRAMSLQLGKSRILLCNAIVPQIAARGLIGVHVSQIRIVPGIRLSLVHFLTLCSRTVCSLWTTIDHYGDMKERDGRAQAETTVF